MIYTICKNLHYSSYVPKIHFGIKSIKGKIKFNKDCNYTLTDATCIDDINKAYGFSYGDHHKWSIRLGWTVKENKLKLFNYIYADGIRKNKRIGTTNTYFEFDTWYDFEITYNDIDKLATVKINNYISSLPFNIPATSGYYLKPYFGGNCAAPQNMTIEII